MSEEPTLPTTQTLAEEMRAGFTEMRAGFAAIQHQLSQMDIRLDRIEGIALQARSEMMYLRADFKELKEQLEVKS